MYGLERAALTEPQQNRMQSFVMRCLRIILGVSLREKRNTAIRKLAKQQRVSSVLMRKRLHFLGHLERMKDERVLKKLLVCAPEHDKTKCRRPASEMEKCSDKGPQALWFKRRLEREGS